jgi:hypothetical protein
LENYIIKLTAAAFIVIAGPAITGEAKFKTAPGTACAFFYQRPRRNAGDCLRCAPAIPEYKLEDKSYKNLFFINALPEPDFRYFSNSKALYLSLKAQ